MYQFEKWGESMRKLSQYIDILSGMKQIAFKGRSFLEKVFCKQEFSLIFLQADKFKGS